MSATFFKEIERAQTPAPVRRKLDAAERRRAAARQAEQEIKDEQALSKLYRRWRRAEDEALRNGPFGREVRGLEAFLATMSLSSAPALIGLVQRAEWIGRMSIDDRFRLLRLVSSGIVRVREKAGLPPFDDEIPWCEPEKAFTTIRRLMGLEGR